jgi:hypothetical protein
MYPEEALGPALQSASGMWEQIESLFENIRNMMRRSGSARSGSLAIAMECTAACIMFLQSSGNVVFVFGGVLSCAYFKFKGN